MRFKNYLQEKKAEIIYMGKTINVEYEEEKYRPQVYRIKIKSNKDEFGQVSKNLGKWEGEIKRKSSGETIRFAGIWKSKKDAIEEVVSILHRG